MVCILIWNEINKTLNNIVLLDNDNNVKPQNDLYLIIKV